MQSAAPARFPKRIPLIFMIHLLVLTAIPGCDAVYEFSALAHDDMKLP